MGSREEGENGVGWERKDEEKLERDGMGRREREGWGEVGRGMGWGGGRERDGERLKEGWDGEGLGEGCEWSFAE